jgi:tight adherence protein C
MTLFLTLLLFCGLLCILVGVVAPHARRDAAVVRLSELVGRPRTLEDLELSQPFSERVVRPLIRKLASLADRFTTKSPATPQETGSAADKTQRRLLLAGSPNRWTVSDWLGVKLFAALCGAGIGGVLVMLVTVAFVPLGILAGAIGGFMAPELWLSRQISSRQSAIRRALPSALDLLVIGVEGGLGFDAAIQRVITKGDNPLTRELTRVLAEMRVGRSRREAWQDMVARTEVQELTNFVAAITQAEQLGVSIVQVLGVQAEQMRRMRRQHAEEQAQQAPLKMLFPMLIFIFPALCVVVLGPLWPALASIWR